MSSLNGKTSFRSVSALDKKKKSINKNITRPSSSNFEFNDKCSISDISYKSQNRTTKKRRNQTPVMIIAYKNGSRAQSVRVIGCTMNELLDECTEKLHLVSAARKLYNADGSEILTIECIIDYDCVFVSTGEAFRNPNAEIKRYLDATRNVRWTTNGLVWNEGRKKDITKPFKMSYRMRKLLGEPKKRFLIFKNGSSRNSVEVVAYMDDIDEIINCGTEKLKLNSKGKILFDWSGEKIEDLDRAPVLDRCLQTWSSPVVGPMWLSCGEGFSPKGVYYFLIGLRKYIKANLKTVTDFKHQLKLAQSKDRALVMMSSLLSMAQSDLCIELETADNYKYELENANVRLNQLISNLKDMVLAEESEGNQYKMKHIKEMEINHALIGDKGLRLKVYRNGYHKHSDEFVVHFNVLQARKSIDSTLPSGPQLLELLIGRCTDAANLRRGCNMRGRRLFTEKGVEVLDVKEIHYDQKLWLSCGEPFKSQKSI